MSLCGISKAFSDGLPFVLYSDMDGAQCCEMTFTRLGKRFKVVFGCTLGGTLEQIKGRFSR